MSPFKQKVIEIVSLVPRGKVVSYGQVAAYIGLPRAARQVGWILRQTGEKNKTPWWRVINQKGVLSIKGNMTADRDLQKKLLEAENIEVLDYKVDIGQYRFMPTKKILKKLQLGDDYIQKMLTKL